MTDSADLRAVFGLGNPGLAYRFHRHNAGFLFLERLLRDDRIRRLEHRAEALSLVDWVAVGGSRFLLVRPQTFMNLSGQAFESVLAAHGWTPRQALLVYDDLDLPLGAFRLRTRGATAGHRGVRSILEAARTTTVPRLRLGVGPRPPEVDAADFVLADFTAAERPRLEAVFDDAVDALLSALDEGLAAAMNRFNVRRAPSRPDPGLPAGPDAPQEKKL